MDITNHERRRLLLLSLGNIAVLAAVGLVVIYASGANIQADASPDEKTMSKIAIFLPVVLLMFVGFGLKNQVFPFRSAMASMPISLLILSAACGFWSGWDIFHRGSSVPVKVIIIQTFRLLFSLALAGYAIKWAKHIFLVQTVAAKKNTGQEEDSEEDDFSEEAENQSGGESAQNAGGEVSAPEISPPIPAAHETPPTPRLDVVIPASMESAVKNSQAVVSAEKSEEPDPYFAFPHTTAGMFLFFAGVYAARFSLLVTLILVVMGLGVFFRVSWFKDVLTGAVYFILGMIVLTIPSFFNTFLAILVAAVIIFSDAIMMFFASERTKKMMSHVELTSMVVYLLCVAFLLWQEGAMLGEEGFRWRHFVLLTGYLFGGYTVFVTARILRLFHQST